MCQHVPCGGGLELVDVGGCDTFNINNRGVPESKLRFQSIKSL